MKDRETKRQPGTFLKNELKSASDLGKQHTSWVDAYSIDLININRIICLHPKNLQKIFNSLSEKYIKLLIIFKYTYMHEFCNTLLSLGLF